MSLSDFILLDVRENLSHSENGGGRMENASNCAAGGYAKMPFLKFLNWNSDQVSVMPGCMIVHKNDLQMLCDFR